MPTASRLSGHDLPWKQDEPVFPVPTSGEAPPGVIPPALVLTFAAVGALGLLFLLLTPSFIVFVVAAVAYDTPHT